MLGGSKVRGCLHSPLKKQKALGIHDCSKSWCWLGQGRRPWTPFRCSLLMAIGLCEAFLLPEERSHIDAGPVLGRGVQVGRRALTPRDSQSETLGRLPGWVEPARGRAWSARHLLGGRYPVLSRSVMCKCLQPCGLQPPGLLCPWGLSRQEYWSGLPFPSPWDLLNPGIKPRSPAGRFFSV